MEGLGKGDACDARDDFRQDAEEVSERDDRTKAADAAAPAALALRGGTKVLAAYGCTTVVERGSICLCTCVGGGGVGQGGGGARVTASL